MKIFADQEIKKVPALLLSLSDSLKKISRESESEFLKIGEQLQSHFYKADELKKTIINNNQLLGYDSNQNLAEKVGDRARKTLLEIQGFQEEITQNLANMDLIIKNLGTLITQCQGIRKTASFINIIALNMGIESSRSIESVEQFSTVAKETRELSQKIAGIIGPIHSDFVESKVKQENTHQDISDDFVALVELLAEADQILSQALNKMGLIMDLSIEQLKRAGNQSKEISRQVGEVVAGLQLHDSMRQRIEHITRAFNEIIELFKEGAPGNGKALIKTDRSNQALSILGLQSAQIEGMISDINNVHQKTFTAFETIVGQIESLRKILTNTTTYNNSSENPDETIDNVGHVLLKLDQLLKKANTLADQIGQTAGIASQAAKRFTSYVRDIKEISLEMHLKALNAIVKANRLGELGKAQDILACELKDCSTETDSFANQIVEILETISSSARDIKITRGMDKSTGEGEETALNEGITGISALLDTYKNESKNTAVKSDDLRQSIIQTRAELEFLPALAGQLTEQLKELDRIKDKLNPDKNKDKPLFEDLTGKLTGNYTMEQEREIHEEVIVNAVEGDFPTPMEPEAEKPKIGDTHEIIQESKEEEKEFGDNVELF